MKAAKVWCVAGMLVVGGLATVSCGKDEGSPKDDGMIIGGEGGTGGSSGNPGRSGSSGTGGTGGSSGLPAASRLGQPCTTDTQCDDASAPGLVCIKETGNLGNGAPPHGLCTAPCKVDADDCEQNYGVGALCFPFDLESNDGYCVEGCALGDSATATKCHDRLDFACSPVALGDTQAPCDSSNDCQAGEGCFDGTCNVAFTACMPACRGDIDCADGKYCDLSFLTGTCVDEKPAGKGIGQPCSILDGEPDDCIGFCQADTAGGTTGHCNSTCAVGAACSYDSASQRFEGLCLLPSVFNPDDAPHVGDWGFCDPVCNCAADCNDPQLGCYLPTAFELPLDSDTGFKAPGLCFGIDETAEQYDQCGSAGAGGAGAGGAGNEGGTPSTPGGAGAGAGGAP